MEFIVTVAGNILSIILGDLILRQRKEVKIEEEKIKNEIIKELEKRKHWDSVQEDLSTMPKEVLDEVQNLAERFSEVDPSLKLIQDNYSFALADPIKEPQLFPFLNNNKKHWKHELERLDEIIAQRKQEVSPLPTPPPHPYRDPEEEEQVTWEYVEQPPQRGHWEQKLIEMDDRIQRRKRGELVVDENE